MKKTLFFHLIAAFSLGSFAAGAATKDVPIEPKLDEIFAPWDSTSSPGCALAVIRDGEVLYSRGYGMANLEHGISISPASVFYVGSVSKQFVAASIALLAEEGALDLDDDIRNYVPEIPEYDRPITIRHMIHHTSGLRDYLTLMALAGKSFADATSEEEVIDLLSRQQELNFSPGEEHLYSNSGYFLLAVIVKRTSGKSLREYAEEKIFAPLGMRHSHFHDDHTMFVTNRAEGHLEQDDGDWGLTRSRFALVGSGGLYTTVEDLYRWDQNFYDNRLGKGGSDFIERLKTPGKLNDGEELDYAFGLNIGEYRGLDTVRHGGALGGYRSHLLRFPSERFSVAIECNLDAINLGPMADQVADLYLEDKLAPKPKPKPPETTRQSESKPETATPTAETLSEYAGEYWSEELQVTYRLSMEDGDLYSQVRMYPKNILRRLSKDVLSGGRMKLTFERDDNKQIQGFALDAGRVRNLRFVKR
jgi:CubicO group peptidase (beta-lactamase class C family)